MVIAHRLARASHGILGLVVAILRVASTSVAATPVSSGDAIETEILDDFEHDRTEHRQVLRTADGKRILLEAGAASAARLPAAPLALPAVHTAAVILFTFGPMQDRPWTPEELRSRVFTAPDSVDAFYQEQSGGQLTLRGIERTDGDVFGWYVVPFPASGCRYLEWEAAARAAAETEGHDLSGYDHLIFVWSPIDFDCTFAGRASLNGPLVYVNGNPSVANLAHEVGHNLGVLHASSAYCTDATGQQVSLSDTCVYSEYGDPFSVMAKGTHHMHAWHKGQLGFLDAAEAPGGTTVTVTESGAFTLAPSEEALPGTSQSLRVPRKRALDGTVLDYYYLELRAPFGTYFDAFPSDHPVVHGVSVRIAYDHPVLGNSILLDMTPGDALVEDQALPVGATFTDDVHGVAVTTLGVGPLGADVQIGITPDATPPTPPTNLRVISLGVSAARLVWVPATDNLGVTHQRVYRDGVQIGDTLGDVFQDTSATGDTTYVYHVVAEDLAGNTAASEFVALTMPHWSPIVQLDSPSDFSEVTSRNRVRVRGSVSSDQPIVRYEVWVDGLVVRTRRYLEPATARPIRRNLRLMGAAGPHTVEVRAYDASGQFGAMGVVVLE
jgi:hypothetical protein